MGPLPQNLVSVAGPIHIKWSASSVCALTRIIAAEQHSERARMTSELWTCLGHMHIT